MKENNIIIKNVFRSDLYHLYNSSFTDNHLLLLVYMQKYLSYRTREINFCMGWLFDDLNIGYHGTQKELIGCFSDLVDMGLIVTVGSVDGKIEKNTKLTVKNIDYDNNYTLVDFDEVFKILSLPIDIRQLRTVLMLYCNIASRIDNKGYCYPSFRNFKTDLNTNSDNRITNALVILKENGLIDYGNVGSVVINGEVTQSNNMYVLCCQEDYQSILARGFDNRREQLKQGKASVIANKKGNEKRRLSQLIYHRQKKFNNNTLDDIGLEELKQYEKEYYNLIKHDTDKVEDQLFLTFDTVDEQSISVNNKVVDAETGEILDNMEQEELLVGRGASSFAKDNVMADEGLSDDGLSVFTKHRKQEEKFDVGKWGNLFDDDIDVINSF